MQGKWDIQAAVSDVSQRLFETVLRKWVGCRYDPIASASQITAAKAEYVFLAKSTMLDYDRTEGFVKIYMVAVPAEAEPKVVNIERIV